MDTYIVVDDKGKLMPWGEFATHDEAVATMCEHAPLEMAMYYVGKKSEYDKHNPKASDE